MEGESGEQVGGELESVTSSAGCFVQGCGMTQEYCLPLNRLGIDRYSEYATVFSYPVYFKYYPH